MPVRKPSVAIEAGLDSVREWEAEHGELTATELAQADEPGSCAPGRAFANWLIVAAGVTYDIGGLIAAESNHQVVWALHRRAHERGVRPVVPALGASLEVAPVGSIPSAGT